MSRKSQLKIGETIFIIIIFFILLTFGLIFYSSYESNSLKKERDANFDREILKIDIAITYFPELSCSDLSGKIEESCIDKYKVSAFSGLINSEDNSLRRQMILLYSGLFGDSKISLVQIYPVPAAGEEEFLIFNQSLSNPSALRRSYIPVLIKEPTNSTYAFGYLKIEAYK